MLICLSLYSKIQELEEELKVVGNNMKSLEVSEAEVRKREEGRGGGRGKGEEGRGKREEGRKNGGRNDQLGHRTGLGCKRVL